MSENILSNFPKDDKDDARQGKGYYIPLIIVLVICFGLIVFGSYQVTRIPDYFEELPEVVGEPIGERPITKEEEIIEETESFEQLEELPAEVRNDILTVYDDYLMAQVVMHEAGNQEMIGKVAVVVTILNRCDYYGLTVEEVVSAPNQYAYPYLGKISDDAYRAVEIARENRDLFPKTMMWFLPSGFPEYGEPYLKIQDHYFSCAVEEEG